MGTPGSKNAKKTAPDAENGSIVSTRYVPQPAPRNDGSSFNLWRLPEDVSHSILVEYLKEPHAVFSDYRSVSKLWHYNLDSEKLWKWMCLFNKCWFPYETEPTNWNRLFLLMYFQIGAYYRTKKAFTVLKDAKSRKIAFQNPKSAFFYPFTAAKQQPHPHFQFHFMFHPPSGQIFSAHTFLEREWDSKSATAAGQLAQQNNSQSAEFHVEPTTNCLVRCSTDLGYFVRTEAKNGDFALHMDFFRTVVEGKQIDWLIRHWNYREKMTVAAYLWSRCRKQEFLNLCDVTYAKTNELILASPLPPLSRPFSDKLRRLPVRHLYTTGIYDPTDVNDALDSPDSFSDAPMMTGLAEYTGTFEDSPQYTGTEEITDSWETLKPLKSPLGISHIVQILGINDPGAKIVSNENTLQLTLRLLKNKVPFTCLEDYLQLTEIQKHLNLVKSFLPLDMPEDLVTMFLEFCLAKEVRDKKVQDELHNCAFLKLGEGAEKVLKDSLKEHGYDKISLGPFTHQLRFSVNHPKEERFDLDFISIDDENKFLAENCSGDNGFRLIENFLSASEMDALMCEIDKGDWRPDLEAKQVQVFGYNYLNPSATPCEIPSYFDKLRNKLAENAFGCYDQLIISDYPVGVGLNPHVDRFYWDEKIIGISLVSGCNLVLKDLKSRHSTTHYLPPGSLYQLQGLSRYTYTHAIEADSVIDRRVSLTFRNLATKSVDFPAEIAQKLKIRSGHSQMS